MTDGHKPNKQLYSELKAAIEYSTIQTKHWSVNFVTKGDTHISVEKSNFQKHTQDRHKKLHMRMHNANNRT